MGATEAMEWDTKLSERATKEIIQTVSELKINY